MSRSDFLVLPHEFAQFSFELQFLFSLSSAERGFQPLLKFLDGFFRGAVFTNERHMASLG